MDCDICGRKVDWHDLNQAQQKRDSRVICAECEAAFVEDAERESNYWQCERKSRIARAALDKTDGKGGENE